MFEAGYNHSHMIYTGIVGQMLAPTKL